MFSRKPSAGLFDPRQVNQAWPEPNVDTNIPYTWGLSGYKHLGYPTPKEQDVIFAEPIGEAVSPEPNLSPEAYLELVVQNKVPTKVVGNEIIVDSDKLPQETASVEPTLPQDSATATATGTTQQTEVVCTPPKGTTQVLAMNNSAPLEAPAPKGVELELIDTNVAEQYPYFFGALCGLSVVCFGFAGANLYKRHKEKRSDPSKKLPHPHTAIELLSIGGMSAVTATALTQIKYKSCIQKG